MTKALQLDLLGFQDELVIKSEKGVVKVSPFVVVASRLLVVIL